ncbi:GNAT family N-acetyltransferase [Sphingomonas sp.]|uniref:GNAT family N-acetyltransferase n=1 Tax=Sphingomonas sp. TaxID=28214 RepID=UPI0025DB336C|nr:GNAT family N-acetyltransferase [Sphingomonas sp.]
MTEIIRRAKRDDLDNLALVGSATFLETFAGILDGNAIVAHCAREHNVATYARHLDEGATAWLAESRLGSAPVGYALLSKATLPGADENDLELKRIYVLSRFHGRQLGAALMNASVAHAETMNASRLLLGVYAGNHRAIAFYGKAGFKQIGTRRFLVGDREYDDVVFARPLAMVAKP